jgi:thioredoxin 1
MSVLSVQRINFKEDVLSSDKPVLVDFWASWCGPCRMLSPVVEQIATEHPEIKVCKINVDEEPELAQTFQISAIPALIFFKNGKPVDGSIGVKSKEAIEEMIKQ